MKTSDHSKTLPTHSQVSKQCIAIGLHSGGIGSEHGMNSRADHILCSLCRCLPSYSSKICQLSRFPVGALARFSVATTAVTQRPLSVFQQAAVLVCAARRLEPSGPHCDNSL
jgi:hypothetical protein